MVQKIEEFRAEPDTAVLAEEAEFSVLKDREIDDVAAGTVNRVHGGVAIMAEMLAAEDAALRAAERHEARSPRQRRRRDQ